MTPVIGHTYEGNSNIVNEFYLTREVTLSMNSI